MHTIKLQVNESIYSQVLSFINQFQTTELNLVEDTKEEDNADFISVDDFFTDQVKLLKMHLVHVKYKNYQTI